jgi:general secretion pathway protein D
MESLGNPPSEALLRRTIYLSLLAAAATLLIGCPKPNQDFDQGRKAEAIEDYDTALVHYERALRSSPMNAEYKLRTDHMRFTDGQYHLELGEKALRKGDLQTALGEFEKTRGVDPSNAAADQELKKTMDMIAAKNAAADGTSGIAKPPDDTELLVGPPVLKPTLHEPIYLKMTNNAPAIFETIAKMAGLSVVFDPDFTNAQHRITVELPNVSLEQALDAVSMASKAIWKPITSNVIYVTTDSAAKRKEVEDEVVKTFYITNTIQPNDLTEIANGLRALFDLRKVQSVGSQNAIVIRDTPDKVLLVEKVIHDLDKAKPEVLIHVQVLTANRDRLRDLGILPGQSVSVGFNPGTHPGTALPSSSNTASTSTSTSTTTSIPVVTLNDLQHLATADWTAALPGATANAILTDNKTQIIQDPEVRITDGQEAKLTIGQKIPTATGSFQAGVGVGVGGGAGVVNPLVNTQFTYQDVGVKIDVTPHVHPDGDVSMKMSIEVSSLDGSSNIGGINQPIIASKKYEADIRLRDGESNIISGLIERTETNNQNGIPGLAQMPLLKYLFSDNSKEVIDNEVLIILTPHIIRFPAISAENLRALASGTDSNVRVYREQYGADAAPTPKPAAVAAPPAVVAPGPQAAIQGASMQGPAPVAAAQLHFSPATVPLKTGETATVGLDVSNVTDLYSIPLLIHYNPAVVQIEEVLDGRFLSGGTQEIAIVQRIDAQRGEVVVSATRQPKTPGVNGSGTLLGFKIRAIGPGTTTLQVLEVNAHDSQQHQIPLVSGEATIQVQ